MWEMALHIPVPNKRLATARLLTPLFNTSNAVIAAQDKKVVESSFPVEVPPAAQEMSVATDKPTLQFGKYYFETLRGSTAQVPAREPQLRSAPHVA
jgi:hypothetical protein